MPRFGDELVRVLQGLGAKPQDVDALRLQGNQVGGVAASVAGWLGPGGTPSFNCTPYEVFAQPGSPVVKRKHIGNQSIPDGVETNLVFDTAEIDTFDAADIVVPDANYKVWTVRFGGVYLVNARARFATNATGARGLYVTDDQAGTTVLRATHAPVPSIQGTAIGITGIFHWPKGATFWVIAQQLSGGALNIDSCFLEVAFLSRFK